LEIPVVTTSAAVVRRKPSRHVNANHSTSN